MSNIKLILLNYLLKLENQLCIGFRKYNSGIDLIRTMPLSYMAYRRLRSYLTASA